MPVVHRPLPQCTFAVPSSAGRPAARAGAAVRLPSPIAFVTKAGQKTSTSTF